jgi:23S rRNA (guanosine2251-2'-O)-methyltransferase
MKGLKGQNPSPRITRPKLAGPAVETAAVVSEHGDAPISDQPSSQPSEQQSGAAYEQVSEQASDQASEGALVSVDLKQEYEMSGTDAFAVSIDL